MEPERESDFVQFEDASSHVKRTVLNEGSFQRPSRMEKFKNKTKSNLKNQLSLFRNKSVFFLLLWNSLIFGYQFTFLRLLFGDYNRNSNNYWLTKAPYLMLYYFGSYILYPFAGWLTDTKLGRYRVMKYSIWLMWISSGVALVSRIVDNANHPNIAQIIVIVVLAINMVALSGFNVNIILFGIDHLTDASTDQSRSFIHWYYWTKNLNLVFISGLHKVLCKTVSDEHNSPVSISLLIGLILSASLLSFAMIVDFNCSGILKTQNPKKDNPFTLIRHVLYYTMKNSSPKYRSAFTYNESYHPKRIDFAKDIYGGPFESDQVEAVKTFINMLKAIIAIGIFSFFYVLNYSSVEYFIKRVHIDNSKTVFDEQCFTLDNIYWTFNPLAIVVFIPLYQLLLAPYIDKYIPRTLKRVGIAVIIGLLSFISLLVLEFIGAAGAKQPFKTIEACHSFSAIKDITTNGVLHINIWYVLIPTILATIAELFGNIAGLEFICAQSPENFKGLMMGLLFAIKGIFNGIASFIILPFTSSQSSINNKTIHCPAGYFALQIVLGVIALILYVVVVRQYKPRQRNPVANERQMIESRFEHMFDEREKQEDNDHLQEEIVQ